MVHVSQRVASPELSVGERIKLLRKHNDIPQVVLSEIMKVRHDRIIRVEKGEDTYTEAHINALKQHLGIVALPLTDREYIAFKERMYYWRSLIRAKKLDEARAIQKDVANIDEIKSYDHDMVMLCKMIEVQLLLAEGSYSLAEDMLNMDEACIETLNDEHLIHYYYNKGWLFSSKGCYEECLNFSLEAYYLTETYKDILPEEDEWLYYNIAWCYSYMEIPYRAAFFALKAKHTVVKNRPETFAWDIDTMLALNYIKTNQLKDAERLLDMCMLRAESIRDSAHIGHALLCYGYMYKTEEKWAPAIEYFDKALMCLPSGVDNYYSSLYQKIYCTIHTRRFTRANQLLEQAKAECSKNKLWTEYFEALGHYLRISTYIASRDNVESIDYIENIAIPKFVKEYDYFFAMEYYNLLKRHYERLKLTKKSSMITNAIHELYKICYLNYGRND